jgi:hypothetical protein
MICQETGYYDDEAPELTDAEIEEAFLDALEQTCPPIEWDDMKLSPGPAALTPGAWIEFRAFLTLLSNDDIRQAADMARSESVSRRAA